MMCRCANMQMNLSEELHFSHLHIRTLHIIMDLSEDLRFSHLHICIFAHLHIIFELSPTPVVNLSI